jgi:4-hydroxymandelate oxidase
VGAPLAKLTSIPPEIAAAWDYAPYARDRVTEAAWVYLDGGAADELTARRNAAAFEALILRPRLLADLSAGHTRLELLGQTLDHPILLAPVANQKLAHPDGDLATATAAAAMHAAMVVSTQANFTLEEIAEASGGPLWFQLYIQHDRDFTAALVRRAEVAGYTALVVTADAPINGLRNREQRAGFAFPPDVAPVNLAGMRAAPRQQATPGSAPLFGSPLLAAAPTWQDLAWLRTLTRLPILLKGVMSAEDALRAIDAGMDGVVVSNHSGRVLDGLPATIEVLPEIASAVGGRVPLLVDGGIRRGGDIFKAIALGASAVLIGRAYVQALAAAGAPGVAHVLHLLRAELEATMVLTGCATLSEIDSSRVAR